MDAIRERLNVIRSFHRKTRSILILAFLGRLLSQL